MAPVFSSRRQAVLCLSLLGFFLLLPFLPKPGWMDRSHLYISVFGKDWERDSNFATYLALQRSKDIDVLFLGSSLASDNYDPFTLKRLLTPVFGRPPVIYSYGHPAEGLDLDYILLKDLLTRRKVKIVIINRNRTSSRKEPRPLANYLWDMRLHWDALKYLPREQRLDIYFYSVMNGLRLILSPVETVRYRTRTQPDEQFRDLGFHMVPSRVPIDVGTPPVIPLDRLIHHRGRKHDDAFVETRYYTGWDRVFSDALFRLCRQKGVFVVFTQAPYLVSDIPPDRIEVPRMAPDQLGRDLPIIAATFNDLFPGRTQEYVEKNFYRDGKHAFAETATYFTKAIFPALKKVIEDGGAAR